MKKRARRINSRPDARERKRRRTVICLYTEHPDREIPELLFTAESRTCCAITGHNLWLEMGLAHRRRRFLMAKPVTITAQKAVNSNTPEAYGWHKGYENKQDMIISH